MVVFWDEFCVKTFDREELVEVEAVRYSEHFDVGFVIYDGLELTFCEIWEVCFEDKGLVRRLFEDLGTAKN